MKSPAPISDADLRTFRSSLRGLIRKVGRQLKDETRACGVGFLTCLVLLELDDAPGCSLKDLQAALGTDKAALSRVVDFLVQHGLARRAENPADRRALAIELTAAGRDRVAVIHGCVNDRYRALFARIPAAERAAVVRAVGYLAEAFDSFDRADVNLRVPPARPGGKSSRPS